MTKCSLPPEIFFPPICHIVFIFHTHNYHKTGRCTVDKEFPSEVKVTVFWSGHINMSVSI